MYEVANIVHLLLFAQIFHAYFLNKYKIVLYSEYRPYLYTLLVEQDI